MIAFFDSLKEAKNQSVRQNLVSWQSLVVSVADGKPPTEHETVATLDRLGKSPDDLQHSVATLQRRRRLAAQIDAAERARSELADLDAKECAATAELNTAQAKYQQAVLPIIARRESIQNEIHRADAARDELRRLAAGSALAAELKSSDDALVALRYQQLRDDEKLGELRGELRDFESTRGTNGREVCANPAREVLHLQSSIARLQAAIAERADAIRELANIAELQRSRLFDPDLVT